MYQIIDVEQWSRREHFHFFKKFQDPFFNVTAPVDVTALSATCKENGWSFFLACLYLSNKVVNAIPEFRYRLVQGEVRAYDQIHIGTTIAHEDHCFSFCYFDFQEDFPSFAQAARTAIVQQQIRKTLLPEEHRQDLIHYSSTPWIAFTSIKHARQFGFEDSIPKIVFGKYFAENGGLQLPVSIEAHHALMDGWHAGQFFLQFAAAAKKFAQIKTV